MTVDQMMPEDIVGKILGQYQLTGIVGSGGLATVFKAFQAGLERWVAIKVLHSQDRVTLARFEREAKAVARLRHRNILMVHEYNEFDSIPFIAMEYVDGGTLADTMRVDSLDWSEAVGVIIPIAEALHHAHQHGLVHRDVKPSNILMAQRDWPLLADFGLVHMQEPGEPLTDTGEIMGTPGYISPEQATGKPVTPRSDLYSLGVVLFELIAGRLPFQHRSPHTILLSHISEAVPQLRQFNPACPRELEQIVIKAMAKAPDDRYPNLAALAESLRAFAVEANIPLEAIYAGTKPLPDVPRMAAPSSTPDTPRSRAAAQRGARLLLPSQNVTITLPEPDPQNGDLIIGREHGSSRIEIDLSPYDAVDAGISRRHARLIKQEAQWFVDDLGSLNGTYLNENKLKPGQPVPLKSNDVIRCSLLSFIFLSNT